MKKLMSILPLALLLFSCQKQLDLSKNSGESLSQAVSNDALLPNKCHTLTLQSLNVVKELYSDTRVKSMNLRTQDFLGINYRWYLKFAYYPNRAKVSGTRSWYSREFARNPDRDTIEVNFNSYGFATTVYTISAAKVRTLRLTLTYNTSNPALIRLVKLNNTTVVNDAKGNILSIKSDATHGVSYTYNTSSPAGKKHFYPPAVFEGVGDFKMGDYFALLELMQWIPPSRNARTSTIIWPSESESLNQTTTFSNHTYDASGNLVSFKYKRNPTEVPMLDKITWHCSQ